MLMALLIAGATPAWHTEIEARMAAALSGLVAAVEDDIGRTDSPLVTIETKGCESRFVTQAGGITVNWHTTQQVGMSDGFIFVSAPPAQFAIVGDVEKAEQWEKLKALDGVLEEIAATCMFRPPRLPQTDTPATPQGDQK